MRMWFLDLAVLAIVLLPLGGCAPQVGPPELHPVQGTWVSDPPAQITIRFHDDGTVVIVNEGPGGLIGGVLVGTWTYNEPTITVSITRYETRHPPNPLVLTMEVKTSTRLCWLVADAEKGPLGELCFSRG